MTATRLDAVTDGVVMVLPDEASSVLTINDRFTEMFGVGEGEMRGHSLWYLIEQMRIPSAVRRALVKQWRNIAPDDVETIEGEFRMTTVTGVSNDIQWYSAPVYRQGEVLGRIFTFHDITPERTAERLRYELLSRISHELRTPLTSIRGFAEFILEAHGPEELPSLAREYTEIIHSSALHLNTLFTDIIELTRADSGQIQLVMNEVNIESVVRQVAARFERQDAQGNLLQAVRTIPVGVGQVAHHDGALFDDGATQGK